MTGSVTPTRYAALHPAEYLYTVICPPKKKLIFFEKYDMYCSLSHAYAYV